MRDAWGVGGRGEDQQQPGGGAGQSDGHLHWDRQQQAHEKGVHQSNQVWSSFSSRMYNSCTVQSTLYSIYCPRYLQYNTVQVYNGQYSLKKNTISIGKLLLNIYYFPPNGQHSLKWTNSLFPKMNNTPYSLKWHCHEISWHFLFHELIFHELNPPGPLINRLKWFCWKIRFCRDIREISDFPHD